MLLAHIRQKDAFHEPVWHVLAALFTMIGLQLVLNDELIFGSKLTIVILEVLLSLILLISILPLALRRLLAISLIALMSVVNLVSLCIVVYVLFGGAHIYGHQLLISSVAIYLTNIIVFGLWYWELDNTRVSIADFQFPQSVTTPDWRPTFFDYLYVSITNATAFSPTDTMPLTHRAKGLMAFQSIISLAVIVLVTARAVNILN
jgi:hypothetical protein